PDDPGSGRPNRGTVAMNVSPEGFARFYVFLPTADLSISALLDSEGPKFVPRVCTDCHQGSSPHPADNADVGSIFREFEASLLEPAPGQTFAQMQAAVASLNTAIRGANLAIRSEAQGSPFGVDHSKAAVNAAVDVINQGFAFDDPARMPRSWAS